MVARAFTELGVEKIRLTGGEPLVRKGIEQLVDEIGALPGLDDFTMTTNGACIRGAGTRSARLLLYPILPHLSLLLYTPLALRSALTISRTARGCGGYIAPMPAATSALKT